MKSKKFYIIVMFEEEETDLTPENLRDAVYVDGVFDKIEDAEKHAEELMEEFMEEFDKGILIIAELVVTTIHTERKVIKWVNGETND